MDGHIVVVLLLHFAAFRGRGQDESDYWPNECFSPFKKYYAFAFPPQKGSDHSVRSLLKSLRLFPHLYDQ